MAGSKETCFILTPFNFKEEKIQSYTETKTGNASDYVDKYDPLIFCRTCANVDPCLVPIFKEEGLDYSLDKKIEKYLPIQVSEEDDLPTHLCYHCASTLIAWESLLIGCVEAEKKLMLMKNSLQIKEAEEVVDNDEEEDDNDVPLNENVDSDDEPLISKKSNARLKKIEDKRDILQEKNDLQSLETVDIKSERPRKMRQKSRKNIKKRQDENRKWSKCGRIGLKSIKKHVRGFDQEEKEEIERKQMLTCPVCRKNHDSVQLYCEDLYSHLNLVENSGDLGPNVCKVCRETCEVLDQLPPHILLHFDVKKENDVGNSVRKKKKAEGFRNTCEICGKMISKKYAMKRHLATHSGEKKFTCHHCGKQYAQESGLQRHVLVIHEGVRKYKCPICSQVFGTNPELKSHQDTHTDPRPFQCDQCGRTFISQKHLYHHRKYHHTANGMRQLCKLCNRYFSSPSVLRRHHKVVHLGLKEFQCHVCSAQLSTKHYLQEHLRLHSDERPEVCSFCGKTFQMAGNLRQHIKTHMGKTQICYVCGKGFTRRCHLLIHMGSHRGLEHPRCEYCGRVFLLKNDLDKHLEKEHSTKVVD